MPHSPQGKMPNEQTSRCGIVVAGMLKTATQFNFVQLSQYTFQFVILVYHQYNLADRQGRDC